MLRRDAIADLLGPAAMRPLRPEPTTGSGWAAAGDDARWETGTLDPDPLLLAGACSRVAGTAVGLGGAAPRVRFRTGTGDTATALVLDGTRAGVERSGGVAVEGTTIPGPASGSEEFTIITGRRSAALVVGGRVVAATPVPEGASVFAEPLGTGVELRNLRTGVAPRRGGC